MKHKAALLVALCSICSLATHAQDTQKDTSQVMMYVERMPQATFNLNKWLSKNIHYPKAAQNADIEGRVLCKFIVNEDGSISDVTVIKSVSPELDAEAVRVLSRMPAWEPGMQNGKAVKVCFTIPIVFALEGKKDPKKLPR